MNWKSIIYLVLNILSLGLPKILKYFKKCPECEALKCEEHRD